MPELHAQVLLARAAVLASRADRLVHDSPAATTREAADVIATAARSAQAALRRTSPYDLLALRAIGEGLEVQASKLDALRRDPGGTA